MAVIRQQDLRKGAAAFHQWHEAAEQLLTQSLSVSAPAPAAVMCQTTAAAETTTTMSTATGATDDSPCNTVTSTQPAQHAVSHNRNVNSARAVNATDIPESNSNNNCQIRLALSPSLPRPVWAMAVRYSLYLLERRAPGEGVEVRVAPWGAIKILDGPASDPHNLTPPDVIELRPEVWLRLATGITTWQEEKDAGRITAVGERDDLSDLLPLV